MKDIIRMNQLAGIITEGQARKMMEVLNELDINPENKDLTQQTGQKLLTKGDIITPDMWKDKNSRPLKRFFKGLGVKSPTDILIEDIFCWNAEIGDCIVKLVLKNQSLSNKVKNPTIQSPHSPTWRPGWYEPGWNDIDNDWKPLEKIYEQLKPEYKIVSMDK